ncbi:MAG: hypothetical protein ACD_61C00240G0001 [uncultured bacterium]|nr:MAG: hypothetical protein ACD_61C00240G0001 [uncultured bacterium]
MDFALELTAAQNQEVPGTAREAAGDLIFGRIDDAEFVRSEDTLSLVILGMGYQIFGDFLGERLDAKKYKYPKADHDCKTDQCV